MNLGSLLQALTILSVATDSVTAQISDGCPTGIVLNRVGCQCCFATGFMANRVGSNFRVTGGFSACRDECNNRGIRYFAFQTGAGAGNNCACATAITGLTNSNDRIVGYSSGTQIGLDFTDCSNGIINEGNHCDCCTAADFEDQVGSVTTQPRPAACRNHCEGSSLYAGYRTTTQNCVCFDTLGSLTDSTTDMIAYSSGNIDGGAFGDPHIMKWNGKMYDFHGECDLVLLQAPDFANGLGLHVHIRTTIQNWFSYIEEVAIKAGDFVTNVNTEGLWIDSELVDAFPAQNGSFRITHKIRTDKEGNNVIEYAISVNKELAVRVVVPNNKYVFVKVVNDGLFSDKNDNYGSAKGLMGQFGTGKTLGRDGSSEFADMDAFGMEWQVQPYEEMLFLTVREPQLPNGVCTMPLKKSDNSRKLRDDPGLRVRAEGACSHADPDMFEMCIDDVIATDDVGIAAGY